MNKNHLTKRLAAIAACVPNGARVADIGSDHAMVPINLVTSGKVDYAVAGEVIAGPFARAQNAVVAAGLAPKIRVRLADGLAAIRAMDQIDTVVIAGMGGILIRDILARGQQELKTVKRLVLEPNVQEDVVRTWLAEQQFAIIQEKILREDQHTYEIIVAERQAQPVKYTELQVKFGPCLVQEKAPVFQGKWQHRLVTNQRILANLEQAQNPPQQKITTLRTENQQIEEVLHG
ncbi:tRNA (adenine(22)-N(1))-methyltransferase [Loigolactobacillus zhaoyuanensis]|uniref:tRNA (Adenine(22)-N(1))-methyltransferase TrmK n=1 Tax=Loigolactobacillus zhaoyuanensis TaxID=2486017 RepID=A0ABW8UCW0_9LACO|nr:tRNA (adenine(22)-N(1))-methyltransferase TrmK [Loigolactobacillus zhaoyuanensis]